MERTKRIGNIAFGICMLIASLIMIFDMEDGYRIIVYFLIVSLIYRSIKCFIYFFLMARFKTGGIVILYKGLILLDAGVFALGLDNIPISYGMIYLIIVALLSGVIDVLQADQSRRMESGQWRFQFAYGASKVVIALLCFFYLNSLRWLTYVYCAGLIVSGVTRISTALRKTAVVYIE